MRQFPLSTFYLWESCSPLDADVADDNGDGDEDEQATGINQYASKI